MAKADWKKIKTEYITTNASYRTLSKKYGVGVQAICIRSQAEGWIAMREQHQNKIVTKTLEKISQKEADRASKIHSVADKLLLQIEAMVDRPEPLNEKAIRALTAAVKDLKEIQSVRTDLDRQEQEARIANLRKQANPNAGKETATLIVEGLPEEFKV